MKHTLGVFTVYLCCFLAGISLVFLIKSPTDNTDDSFESQNQKQDQHSESGSETQDQPTCGYSSCHAVSPSKLNIHIIPHSHDDAGWLYTVDKYFEDRVYYVINNVIFELEQNPDRKFIEVEIAFFERWWRVQDDGLKARVKALVNSGHWTMPDEAITYYSDLITNAEIGMRWIEETFGSCGRPLVGWQIDPFGHSRGVQKLYQKMGYDGWFIGRVDYEDYRTRTTNGEMEFTWNGFWTSINNNVYRQPNNFCWDTSCDNYRDDYNGNEFMIDDPDLVGTNIEKRLDQFLKFVEDNVNTTGYTTNHVMVTFGNDFHYTNADKYFVSLDKLIKYLNLYRGDKYNALYSTPACYMEAAKNAKLESSEKNWPTYEKDFFPYCDGYWIVYEEPKNEGDKHGYWSGYYSSRSLLKSNIRSNSSLLNACNQLETGGIVPIETTKWLRRAIGLTQHHDAVTGTEKQHVVDDYNRRLSDASDTCLTSISESHDAEYNDKVMVYNSLGWPRREIIEVWGKKIQVEVPALGWKVFNKTEVDKIDDFDKFSSGKLQPNQIQNSVISASISQTGDITVTDINTQNTIKFKHQWHFYDSCHDTEDSTCQHNSGAYIFVPQNETPNAVPTDFDYFRVDETELKFNKSGVTDIQYSWVLNENNLVLEYNLGPLEVDFFNRIGKEVITRFEIDNQSASVLVTDTNMFGKIERDRSDIQCVNSLLKTSFTVQNCRYMPITAQGVLKFDDGFCFTVTTDRSAGVTSLTDTQFDIMLHRRTLVDDGKGLSEPMNDDTVLAGKLVLGLGNCRSEAAYLFQEKRITHKLLTVYGNDFSDLNSVDGLISKTCDESTCSLFKTRENGDWNHLDKNLFLHTLARDAYRAEWLVLRFENMSENGVLFDLAKLGVMFDFNRKIDQVKVVTLAATEKAEVHVDESTVEISAYDILTLRVSFE